MIIADRYGQGRPVVLLHGQPGSAGDWSNVVPLLERDFAVVVPDRPGYGRTAGAALGFAGNARALVDLLDHMDLGPAIVVGHSWAGAVALATAAEFADRVSGLVLVAGVVPGTRIGLGDRLLAAPLLGEVMAGITIASTGKLLSHRRVQQAAARLDGTAREVVDALARLTGAGTGSQVWRSFLVEQRALVSELARLAPAVGDLDIPAVVLNGSADHIVDPAAEDSLTAALKGSEHVVIEGAGHLLPHDHPGAVAGAVRRVASQAA